MSEAAGAAAGGAGDGGATAGGAGTGAGAAGAGGAAAAGAAGSGAAAGAGTAAVAAVTPAAAVDHFGGLDADTRGWLTNKGYFGQDLTKADVGKGIAEMIKQNRSLESIVGRKTLAQPRDVNDAEAYTALHKALGHPPSAADYGIKPAEGADPKFATSMAEILHKHGLGIQQAQGLAADYTALVEAGAAEREAQFVNSTNAELAAVKKDWGPQSDANFAAAQRFSVAAKAWGLDKPVMEKIERAIGTKAMLSIFAGAGRGLTEDRGAGAGGSGAGLAPTAEGAQSRLKELNADKDFAKRYTSGDATAKREYDNLLRIVAGDAA